MNPHYTKFSDRKGQVVVIIKEYPGDLRLSQTTTETQFIQ